MRRTARADCLTGKSGRLLDSSSPVPLQKIKLFSPDPNHFYKRRRLAPQRGVSRSSRTRSGMRWTRGGAKDERACLADGEVVWF